MAIDFSAQDADIIVFPEIGLVSYGSGTNYTTPLPNPDDMVLPCNDTSSNVTVVQLYLVIVMSNVAQTVT